MSLKIYVFLAIVVTKTKLLWNFYLSRGGRKISQYGCHKKFQQCHDSRKKNRKLGAVGTTTGTIVKPPLHLPKKLVTIIGSKHFHSTTFHLELFVNVNQSTTELEFGISKFHHLPVLFLSSFCLVRVRVRVSLLELGLSGQIVVVLRYDCVCQLIVFLSCCCSHCRSQISIQCCFVVSDYCVV